ncbi:translation initiation factor IF-2-like [Eucalyptus grandis]|uniref:translation initiation factor IF-2-like n=1 Tax=Eucalyptus grandis TaxID=71139 RepID=UPI00192E7DFA|nr:translation initiation factor IF-2-like [Eucalyptus grandis]
MVSGRSAEVARPPIDDGRRPGFGSRAATARGRDGVGPWRCARGSSGGCVGGERELRGGCGLASGGVKSGNRDGGGTGWHESRSGGGRARGGAASAKGENGVAASSDSAPGGGNDGRIGGLQGASASEIDAAKAKAEALERETVVSIGLRGRRSRGSRCCNGGVRSRERRRRGGAEVLRCELRER